MGGRGQLKPAALAVPRPDLCLEMLGPLRALCLGTCEYRAVHSQKDDHGDRMFDAFLSSFGFELLDDHVPTFGFYSGRPAMSCLFLPLLRPRCKYLSLFAAACKPFVIPSVRFHRRRAFQMVSAATSLPTLMRAMPNDI